MFTNFSSQFNLFFSRSHVHVDVYSYIMIGIITPLQTLLTSHCKIWPWPINRHTKICWSCALSHPETPASRALNDTINTDTKKPRGGQRMTWMKCLQKDLNKANITLNQALDVSQDRAAWRQIVHKMRRSRSNQDVWTDDICISQSKSKSLSTVI